jgi:signal peptidase II
MWGPLSSLGLVLAVLIFAVDQLHKWWLLYVFGIAERQPVTLVPGFDLVLVWNHGISYGWFASHEQGTRWILVAIALVVSAFLWRWLSGSRRPVTAAALGLIIGAALANALARVIHGAVVDMFHFHVGSFSWYVFNLADVAIVAGVGLLLYESWAEGRHKPEAPLSP